MTKKKKTQLRIPWHLRHWADIKDPEHWGEPQGMFDTESSGAQYFCGVVHLSADSLRRLRSGKALRVGGGDGVLLITLESAVDAHYVDEEGEMVV